MAAIPPSAEELAANAPLPTSEREHLTTAPTLLPTVIFQDLVFGRDRLGLLLHRAVLQARAARRRRRRPEYAAKVFKRELISELATRRRSAARSSSSASCSTRASRGWSPSAGGPTSPPARVRGEGDLHGQLRRMGSLAEANARFLRRGRPRHGRPRRRLRDGDPAGEHLADPLGHASSPTLAPPVRSRTAPHVLRCAAR